MSIPLPLQPHEVRWFYHEFGKFWQPFGGYDSLCLESCYLECKERGNADSAATGEAGSSSSSEVTVKGDLYAVNVEERTMEPLYWPSKYLNFNVSGHSHFAVLAGDPKPSFSPNILGCHKCSNSVLKASPFKN